VACTALHSALALDLLVHASVGVDELAAARQLLLGERAQAAQSTLVLVAAAVERADVGARVADLQQLQGERGDLDVAQPSPVRG